jgi:hypothetical protein
VVRRAAEFSFLVVTTNREPAHWQLDRERNPGLRQVAGHLESGWNLHHYFEVRK